MLQRYDITKDGQTDCLSIKEFAVLKTKLHKRHDYKPIAEDYSIIHEVSFGGDSMRTAIKEGQKALISELRSGDFFPIYPCAELIAKSVTTLFNGNSDPKIVVFFDDRSILPSNFEK